MPFQTLYEPWDNFTTDSCQCMHTVPTTFGCALKWLTHTVDDDIVKCNSSLQKPH